ncbi:hypothetical protein Btru_022975 [Bulinus truncatus]|nr:hypothetical protein Btru_022975 [Bulinus truncatus]
MMDCYNDEMFYLSEMTSRQSNDISLMKIDLNSFKISYVVGFMLENPLKTLPEYFRPWNTLAKDLPALYKEKKVREAIKKLPLLDHKRLVGHRQLRLARVQLSFITAGYVWQDGDQGAPKFFFMVYQNYLEYNLSWVILT